MTNLQCYFVTKPAVQINLHKHTTKIRWAPCKFKAQQILRQHFVDAKTEHCRAYGELYGNH